MLPKITLVSGPAQLRQWIVQPRLSAREVTAQSTFRELSQLGYLLWDILYFSGTVLYHPYITYSVVYSLARQESELIYCILNKELTWELISSLHGALLILELTKWVRLALQSMTICWFPGPPL